MNDTENIRINDQIRIKEVRLVDSNGQQIGVRSIFDARMIAAERGLDLVEINPNSRPPVCKLMDFGKYKFELKKKEKAAKAAQHIVSVKQINFHPNTQEHDYSYRLKQAKEFLLDGNKVKVCVQFRGREMNFLANGKAILDKMAEDLKEVATVETHEMEGKIMFILLRAN